MDWIRDFYDRQIRWSGTGDLPVSSFDVARVEALEADYRRYRPGRAAEMDEPDGGDGEVRRLRVLELGAGDGQTAAATAERGHDVIAVELVGSRAARARRLAQESSRSVVGGRMRVVEGDFYDVEVGAGFDVVAYWDGFGVGEDPDQRRLFDRIAKWLAPGGIAVIEVYTPWYWAAMDGREMAFGDARRRYGFDADGVRMRDTWWPAGREDDAVTQTLRCYGPADLRLLLEGTGLTWRGRTPGGAVGEDGTWQTCVPLSRAMNYRAVLAQSGDAQRS